MARIRTIKPTFFTSLTVAGLPVEARLTFIGLWTHVDDDGRCVLDYRLFKAAIWPLDDRGPDDLAGDITALQRASLVSVYTVKKRAYLVVNGWKEHQKINRPTSSILPAPPTRRPPTSGNGARGSVSPQGDIRDGSVAEGKGREGKGREAVLALVCRRVFGDARDSTTDDEIASWSVTVGRADLEAELRAWLLHSATRDLRDPLAALRGWLRKAARRADAAPPGCTVCADGWLGDDEAGRPRPCPACRPNVVPIRGAS